MAQPVIVDTDILIDFGLDRPDAVQTMVYAGSFDQFMGFKQRLEEIYQRPVDLLTIKRFRNPLFQQEVDKSKTLVYAAGAKKAN